LKVAKSKTNQNKTLKRLAMKRLSLLELHNAEIKRSMLGKIKGGIEVKCLCSMMNPVLSTRESGSGIKLCMCDTTATATTVQNRVVND
jgi:hypothetical protein